MKPVCECGGELEYYEIRSIEVTSQIRKNGRTSAKRKVKQDGGSFMSSGLHCKKCNNAFEADMGIDRVLIRGERL